MEDAIVLYPSPAIGHLISMVELGKLILTHHPSFSIQILIVTAPYNTGSTAPYINRVSATIPAITFHHLPTVSLPLQSDSPHYETLAFDFLRLNNPHVHQALISISQNSTVHALIIDGFCTPAMTVAADLKIPAYYFHTSGAYWLATFLYLPTIHRNTTKSFKDLNNTYLDIPGVPPILATDMPNPILDRTDKAYQRVLNISIHYPKSAGIIVNTFQSLEARAVKTISEGLCVPDQPTPPLYCIGPLIATHHGTGGGDGGTHECLMWLDSQPSRSVVFLCFGSLGLLSEEQLKEIAVGLERSGHRFMWVVRSPPSDQSRSFLAPPEPDLESLLPKGFLERTRERGLVVKSWAPQVAVLSHDSVGGFVTHCGWNSVLEAVCAGQPMVAWPLYAEQKNNMLVLVEELKLALRMTESDDGFVSAAEVEKRVRELMDSEEGKLIRNQMETQRGEARAAMRKGGSSRVALAELVRNWNMVSVESNLI
ncbi:UDP-glycosyltransferase 88B1-like [Cornus florida]|uniref:UDP-glycosyltransferase 88B1-like n=1 Tax=Cornus florida TaxID=4283 RepID=UPI00289D6654|nr:UDP-glycosyltransferase 88B1-like [Cornus florida]